MTANTRAVDLASRLRGLLVAAAATPMAVDGNVDSEVVDAYLRSLIADGAGGLAVCVHTGRGPLLQPEQRHLVISAARRTGVPVVVGVGGGKGGEPEALAAAQAAAVAGADALLVFPTADDPVGHHDALWRATGVPLIAFDLYTQPYPGDVLYRLLEHPGVAGVKLARMHDAVACQTALQAAAAADRLPITGEDRMFGPSLLWGAQAALVGIAAASVQTSAAVLSAFHDGRFADFIDASGALDTFAAATFRLPYEGYIQRMLWVAAAEGRIPEQYAHDLFRPGMAPAERDEVLAAWRRAAASPEPHQR